MQGTSLEIDIDDFQQEHAAGATLIDVREPAEYQAGHVPGAILVPLSELRDRLDDLPRDQQFFVICEAGGRSYSAASALSRAGYQAVSVRGGTSGWRRRGLPVER